jgi:deoxyribodipyrimidine photo-lyase
MTHSNPSPALMWFRDDLRIADNPALSAAVETGRPVLSFFIMEEGDDVRPHGAASKFWLHGSLENLQRNLGRIGGSLVLFRGPSSILVKKIAHLSGAQHVFWNRRYDPRERELDGRIKHNLEAAGIHAESFNGRLVCEPWQVKNGSGAPFKVFTPFWKAVLAKGEIEPALAAPLNIIDAPRPDGLPVVSLQDLALEPTQPDWSGTMRKVWQRGEDGAHVVLSQFLKGAVRGYAEDRNLPGTVTTSKLSPYLRFGDISVRQIWSALKLVQQAGDAPVKDADKFLSEVGWRDFAYNLLFHFGPLADRNMNTAFDNFPWVADEAGLKAWQKGRTGYPIVDAGMREVWQTGWMHNRVRMITASFLIKHLLIDWRKGEQWFWDTLLDADPANNPASWQWVAGSGADAAPYYRIFNPIIQGEKFDKDGAYVRRYVPELSNMPDAYIHKPWEAPSDVLSKAGVVLGKTYPRPIIEHDFARKRALAALETIKKPDLS